MRLSLRFAIVVAALALAGRADAIILCPPDNFPCYTQNYACVCNSGGPLPQLRQAPRRWKRALKVGSAPDPSVACCDYCEDAGITYKTAGTACTDDGNACTDDVCNDTGSCMHNPVAGTPACTDDGNACTSDYCSGGACQHVANTGAACTSDGNPCTTDACDGTGACTHTNATGGSACNGACIPAGTCCDNPNTCTGGRTCSGPGGSCGCPSGTYDCNGACISTSSCCANPNNCSGGKVCGNGSCACPTGTYDCGGTCIASATCCTSPNNCSAPANGTGVCPSNGGTCTVSCNGGYKQCGNACIASNLCCVDGDCPSDAAKHLHGVCGAGGVCASACDNGFKICGTSCIPLSACCGNADCTSPPGACYKAQGTCNAGACSYAADDGKACNADSDACTPNDRCMGGTCVADTANAVKCVQRECHTAPTCNKATGNCDDAVVGSGTACGGNGCSDGTGTCNGSGTCSVPAKDCSSLNTQCTTGQCDAAAPTGTPCATVNVLNGTACTLTDKCMLMTACNGGQCVGTPKVCTPSDDCHVAMCNPSTGGCEESAAPVGTACNGGAVCLQNAACDATGQCVGDTVPDGTPCDNGACSDNAACVTGACICVERPDFGGDPLPLLPGDAPDMSDGSGSGSGCAFGGSPRLTLLALLVVLAALWRRRRAISDAG